jgi:hypothetical protein
MQVQLTGFLERNAKTFMADLWDMLISAQSSAVGIPAVIIEQRQQEQQQQQVPTRVTCCTVWPFC